MTLLHYENGHPVLGSARELAREPHRFIADLALKHGGICGFRAFNRRMIAVADPDIAHEMLVTKWQRFVRTRQALNLGLLGRGLLALSGDEWLERRRLAQTAFSKALLGGLAEVTARAVRSLLSSWEAERNDTGSVDLEAWMLRLSMTIIARMLLSAEIAPATADDVGRTLRRGLQLILARNTAPWAPPLWLPTPGNRALAGVRRELTAFVSGNMEGRSARAPDGSDLLAALTAARDPRTGRALSPDALLEETKTLFFAGYETVSTALTWALYLLARHPAVAAAAQRELDQLLGGREPTADDLHRLPRIRAILQETMRIYPPVYALPRMAIADDELGGHPIRRGTVVIASIAGVHRSPAWGEDADQFRPDRFLGPEWPRRAFIPFGAGRHLCIGNDFATVEMAVALAMILQRYELHTPSLVQAKARVTQVPDGPIALQLRSREPFRPA